MDKDNSRQKIWTLRVEHLVAHYVKQGLHGVLKSTRKACSHAIKGRRGVRSYGCRGVKVWMNCKSCRSLGFETKFQGLTPCLTSYLQGSVIVGNVVVDFESSERTKARRSR
jgi:hypothetical protein